MDKMHGRGVYIWAEGARYEGEYKEDKKNGRGVQTWPSGARYEGEYVDSMQTGYGLMTWADGRRYEGYWVNSKCTGFGILTHKDGRRYEGEYVNDKMQGHGVYTWANGAKYDGEYKDNKKNGRGVHTWPDGSMYEGQYLDGMQTGQGYMAWGDGRVYRGAWLQSKCTGYGVLTHADGRRYEGYYVKDKMHGHGVYTWPDGRKYNGEYKNNLKHGNGIWTWPDGVMLEGQWADNLPCRHACTVIFSSYVSTTEVQPRVGLDTDTTLQKLWEDAHVWRQEHNVSHELRRAPVPAPMPRVVEAKAQDDDEVAPRGAAVASVSLPPQSAADGARAAGDYIQGANSASVDVGRSADQSTEMFRALRSVAMQLDQGLAEMEDIPGVLDEQAEASHAGIGPAASKADGKAACGPNHGADSGNQTTARLLAIRDRLVQQVQMLHLELDRHGGAERLVASASKGAGSADACDNDEFPAAAPSLREMSLREMSLEEVCEALASKGLSRYIETFRAAGLDGAQLSEMDEQRLAHFGVEHQDRAAVLDL